jgi:hypothetical protein
MPHHQERKIRKQKKNKTAAECIPLGEEESEQSLF